jgi:hypothetical protein
MAPDISVFCDPFYCILIGAFRWFLEIWEERQNFNDWAAFK